MHNPIYTGRKGSKCYFTYDKQFFDQNKSKCLKLIAFYTLCLFGHQEAVDNVLRTKKDCFEKISINECMDLIFKGKLRNRIFHLPDCDDNKLMTHFEGCALVTSDLIKKNKLACKVERIHDQYPSMHDTFEVGVYVGTHVCECSSNDSVRSSYLLGKRTSDWETSTDIDADFDVQCDLCDAEEYINDNFTFHNDDDIDPEAYVDERRQITMNNLIFNFRNYKFIIDKKSDSECVITFNKKAVGGYVHASFSTGASFEVYHAVPDTLEHIKTSHVNSMTIAWKEFDGEYIIVSQYKAIDIL